jgi:hypothetical protein
VISTDLPFSKQHSGLKEIYGLAVRELGPALLHAAAFTRSISGALIEPLSSYQDIVLTEFINPHICMVRFRGHCPYDMPDLAASLAPGNF